MELSIDFLCLKNKHCPFSPQLLPPSHVSSFPEVMSALREEISDEYERSLRQGAVDQRVVKETKEKKENKEGEGKEEQDPDKM